ncbi:Variant surface glycoprotein [Trypanosoma congolense IL3000]|uniref:Variant surface glycoprotein n=1 Tax=Trypanosoma congolense (strain IL3000) TaxID=1068625 RepID=F9WD90_TRYCI|nr:Variant surface glycoprotein [Trypanosoma congolense IL3000]
MIKFLMVMMVIMGVNASGEARDHNHDAHKALCDLMKAAVAKLGSNSASNAMKEALHQTIFGNKSGGNLDALKGALPKEYYDGESRDGDRGLWCGQPFEDSHQLSNKGQPRWPGHSGPHDLLCLCTVGQGGFPLNKSEESNMDTLCGKNRDSLVGSGGTGWGDSGNKAESQLKATWDNVIKECLNGVQGKGLKETLENFLGKLKHNPDTAYKTRYRLGEGNVTIYAACNGTPQLGDCVMYYNATKPLPWWTELEKALPEEEKFQQQKQREEEEKRKQQEQAAKQDSPKAETLTSTPQTTNQTEASNKDNITDKLRRYNLTSGTHISQPTSWLLSVAILI